MWPNLLMTETTVCFSCARSIPPLLPRLWSYALSRPGGFLVMSRSFSPSAGGSLRGTFLMSGTLRRGWISFDFKRGVETKMSHPHAALFFLAPCSITDVAELSRCSARSFAASES
jgi:hypothetical protein